MESFRLYQGLSFLEAKGAVSTHNAFPPSYFVFITEPQIKTLSGLPLPLFAPFFIVSLLIERYGYWWWLLCGHMEEAEMAHVSPASPLSFILAHSWRQHCSLEWPQLPDVLYVQFSSENGSNQKSEKGLCSSDDWIVFSFADSAFRYTRECTPVEAVTT